MGRSAGTGFPQFFQCWAARRTTYWRDNNRFKGHDVTLTGRTKPTPRGVGNPRKSWTTYEYRCSCGHVGWSNHKDLERKAAHVASQTQR